MGLAGTKKVGEVLQPQYGSSKLQGEFINDICSKATTKTLKNHAKFVCNLTINRVVTLKQTDLKILNKEFIGQVSDEQMINYLLLNLSMYLVTGFVTSRLPSIPRHW